MSTESNTERTKAVEVIRTLRWPVVVIAIGVLGFLISQRGVQAVEQSARAPERTVERAAEAIGGIAERFRTGKITTTFVAALPRLAPDRGSKLELVAFESVETFRRRDERRVLFDLVPLGTTETEIRVPVTYRYHLRLDDPWQIDVRDQDCVVRAPRLRATQPPAIHTDGMEKRSSEGWLRFDAEEQMDELLKTVTPTLERRAEASETIELIREEARLEVGEFVRNWLLLEDHWREDRFRSVTIIFADERGRTPEITPPTVVYQGSHHISRPTGGPTNTEVGPVIP